MKNYFLKLVIIVLLLFPVIMHAQENWDTSFKKGQAAVRKGYKELAIKYFQLALSDLPENLQNTEDHAWIYLNLGSSYGDMDDFNLQKEFYNKSLSITTSLTTNAPILKGFVYNYLGVFASKQQQEDQAIKYYKLSIPHMKEAGYITRKEALQTISNLINSYFTIGDDEMALKTIREYLNYVDESIYNKFEVWEPLYRYGEYAKEKEDYNLALELFDEVAYRVNSDQPDDSFINYDTAKFLTAQMHRKLGDFWSGIYDLGLAEEYVLEHFPNNERRLLNIYNLKATLYNLYEEPEDALQYYKQVLKILLEYGEEDNAVLIQTMQQIYGNLIDTDNFEEAVQYEISIATLETDMTAKDSAEEVFKLIEILGLHIIVNEYIEAAQLSVKIRNHPSFKDLPKTSSRNYIFNTGVIAFSQGDYKTAEEIYTIIIKSYEDEAQNDLTKLKTQLALGDVYLKLGDYQKSAIYYNMVFESTVDKVGYDFEYEKKTAAIGLADIFIKSKKYNQASSLLEQWVAKKSNISKNHHFRGKNYLQGRLLSKLAESYILSNQINKAVQTNEQALKHKQKSHKENHIEFAPNLLIKARISAQKFNFKESQEYINKALILQKSQLGESSLEVTETLLLSLQIAMLDNNSALIKNISIYLSNAIINFTNSVFIYKSEEEKKILIENTVTNVKDAILESALILNESEHQINQIALNIVSFYNGIVLSRSRNVLNKLRYINKVEINGGLELLAELKLERAEKVSIGSQKETIKKITSQIQEIESLLNIYYNSEFPSESLELDTLSEITIRDNETLLTFAQYQNQKGSIHYICFVENKATFKPQLISLFDEENLSEILSKSLSQKSRYINRGGTVISVKKPKYGKALYDLIWKPLEDTGLIGQDIYYVPSGLLKTISFAALPQDNKMPLIVSKNLFQLSRLQEKETYKTKLKTLSGLLIGGINYSSKEDEVIQEVWSYLPGTKVEVDNLAGIFNSSSTLTGNQATEKIFTSMDHTSHAIIHIATHGFFNTLESNPTASIFKRDPDPMVRSGLLFSGANSSWNTVGFTTINDGILTSLEVSNLNLSNTNLVVMSACETGLGDIEGSEGVYGLQRAFKLAGVQSILMSLWEVPDKETSEFMTLFYRDIATNQNIHSAFLNTQRTMYSKYPDAPDKWAAFVLID